MNKKSPSIPCIEVWTLPCVLNRTYSNILDVYLFKCILQSVIIGKCCILLCVPFVHSQCKLAH